MAYAKAEREVAYQTGIRVPAKTQERLVHRQTFAPPTLEQPITEVCVDGGKVRLRTPLGEPSEWRHYTAIETAQGMVANFRNNAQLVDGVNQQPLADPLTGLGDGHDGVWNIFAQLASAPHRRESLDWYQLKENLYQVGGSLKRLKQAEAFLWTGPIDATLALFDDSPRKQAQNFCGYWRKHRHRIVHDAYFQAEGICSMGAGAVESAIKQIDQRLHLTGAQWKAERVTQGLAQRCAYLNDLIGQQELIKL